MNQPYYHTKESVTEYIKLSDGINGEEHIKELRKVLAPDSRLLELGSGPGSDWEILSKTYRVTGSDLSNEFLQYLTLQYPEGNFINIDAETIKVNNKFDGIYSNKVLHHLSNEALKNSITSQNNTLEKDGIICHTFWKGSGSETFKGMFVNYHDKNELEKLFGEYFEIALSKTYKEFDENDSILLIGKRR